jgi:hypothetical protein
MNAFSHLDNTELQDIIGLKISQHPVDGIPHAADSSKHATGLTPWFFILRAIDANLKKSVN